MDTDQTAAPATIEDEMTLVLLKPIAIGTVEYAELSLTEPIADQLIKSSKAGNGIEQLVSLIHLNAKVPMGVATQLRNRDLNAASSFFARFSDAIPPPTATPSPS